MSESEPADAPFVPEASPVTPVQDPEWALPDVAAPPAPGHVPTSEPALGADPAPRKRIRKRTLWISTAVVAALALAGGAVVAFGSGRTGDSIVTKVRCQPEELTKCLIKAPAGAVKLSGADSWYQALAPSADLYSANVTKDAAGVGSETSSLLNTNGLQHIAHTDWNAVDGNNVDLVLLQFGSQKGAQDWNSTRTAEIMAAYPGQSVAIPGDSTAKAFAAAKADPQGDIDAAYSTVVGNLVLNVVYSSPKQLSAQDLETWAGTELASLRTAPAAAPDPADTAQGTERVACTTRLGSCLMSTPSGDSRWTAPLDKHWISGSTLTPSQFVTLEWDSKANVQSEVLSNFSADGVTGIAHTDWADGTASKQADIYLIQTITEGGAKTLGGSNFGEPDWSAAGLSGVSVTLPGEPDAQAWRTNKKDSNGFYEFSFTAEIGNVIVDGWCFFYGSFDSGTAVKWAQSQLNQVSRSASTQSMGLFPLDAPKPPTPGQGTCPASGDCLLPSPAGATDTTSTSYQVSNDITALAYTSHYDAESSSEAGTWLTADGFKSAEHRSWTAADGATADAVLLKYGKPAQAQAAALLDYGLNAPSDRICTAAPVADSLCLATTVNTNDPLQNETVWVLAWKGDYEVSVSVTASNRADVADAYAWAQHQLDLLPVN